MITAQWLGTEKIQIGTVPKPMITATKDTIVRVTHCTIGGSDSHMYIGELNSAMQKGDIVGHEAIGIVEGVGPEITKFKKDDRITILPVIACGHCFYRERQEYSLWDTTNLSKELEEMWGPYLLQNFLLFRMFINSSEVHGRTHDFESVDNEHSTSTLGSANTRGS